MTDPTSQAIERLRDFVEAYDDAHDDEDGWGELAADVAVLLAALRSEVPLPSPFTTTHGYLDRTWVKSEFEVDSSGTGRVVRCIATTEDGVRYPAWSWASHIDGPNPLADAVLAALRSESPPNDHDPYTHDEQMIWRAGYQAGKDAAERPEVHEHMAIERLETIRAMVVPMDPPAYSLDPSAAAVLLKLADEALAALRSDRPEVPHPAVEPEANLGLATTGDLLDELRSRIAVDYYSGGGGLSYTTVGGRPPAHLDEVEPQVVDVWTPFPCEPVDPPRAPAVEPRRMAANPDCPSWSTHAAEHDEAADCSTPWYLGGLACVPVDPPQAPVSVPDEPGVVVTDDGHGRETHSKVVRPLPSPSPDRSTTSE